MLDTNYVVVFLYSRNIHVRSYIIKKIILRFLYFLFLEKVERVDYDLWDF